MIYLVTKQQQLFVSDKYTIIDRFSALSMILSWGVVQFDTETLKKNPHIGSLLCAQFGNDKADARIVVDCTTVPITFFKEVFYTKLIIGHNLKFDLQWLYKEGIVPVQVYDTMIVEEFIYLGYPRNSDEADANTKYLVKMGLADLVNRYLGEYLDKTVRGEIIWRGLMNDRVILYAAGDVTLLEKIMIAQVAILKKRNALKGAQIECEFVKACAYLEWCGIKLDEEKWKIKMANDREALEKATKELNDYAISNPKLQKWVYQDFQGDLFDGFDTSLKWGVDWQKKEAYTVIETLGFNIDTVDKKTGQPKKSIEEKVLKPQKGIDDTFLKLYLNYQEHYKVCTSFGQGHLNLINPITGRIHTNYWQIGTISGRMSSGGGEDEDLARLKHLFPRECKLLNMQQLPKNAETRSCFISEPGNLFCSCDYSAMEARIGAEVYNEKALLDEFLIGSGDTHAAYAKVVFAEELKDVPVSEIKAKRPDLRNKVKNVEFAVQFGSDGSAVASQLGISVPEAQTLVKNLLKGMNGLARYKEEGSKFARNNGFVYAMKQTGHRATIPDWKDWNIIQKSLDEAFWERYKPVKEKRQRAIADGQKDKYCYMTPEEKRMAILVSSQWRQASKWDRLALNIPTQGGGAVVLKTAVNMLFKWIVDNGYFNKILLVNLTHDEINTEFPEELKDTYPQIVSKIMQDAAALYYHKLPIPAEPSVGDHWIH